MKREYTLLWAGLLLWIAGCSWYQPKPDIQSDSGRSIAVPAFDWGGLPSEAMLQHVASSQSEPPARATGRALFDPHHLQAG